MSWGFRGPECTCSWLGDVGSVNTVSQLLSWNQALGLPRTVLVLDVAVASMEFCRSGPHRRKPFAWAAHTPHYLGRSGRYLWLTDLRYLCGRETWKVYFLLRISLGSENGSGEQSCQQPWPKENELGQGAYQVGSEQVVLWGRLGLYGRAMGDCECLRQVEEEKSMSILKGVLQGWIYGEMSQAIYPDVIQLLTEHPCQVGKVRGTVNHFILGLFSLASL